MPDNPPNVSSPLKIYRVTHFDKLHEIWPAIMESLKDDTDKGLILERILGCISHGLVFVIEDDGNFFGFCAVETLDSANCVIHCFPTAPASGLAILEVRKWAKEEGITNVRLVSHRFNGSNLRYIEKVLGFHREAIVFVQKID